MPEGDTIFRAARTLNRALAGQTVTRFETMLPQLSRIDQDAPIAGRVIESIESHGKWMLMRFSGDLTLLTHMRMNGSWHIYRPEEAWQRGRQHMRIVIETVEFVAVGFDVPVAEFHDSASLARHPSLTQLGPDVLDDTFDPAEAARRLRQLGDLTAGEALLRQSLLAGVGNVFKSEICFACQVNPFRLVSSLTEAELLCLTTRAREYLLANVRDASRGGIVTYRGFRRTTRRADPGSRLWVYGRNNQPCRNCGTPVQSRKQGDAARVSFWCPNCQPMERLKQ